MICTSKPRKWKEQHHTCVAEYIISGLSSHCILYIYLCLLGCLVNTNSATAWLSWLVLQQGVQQYRVATDLYNLNSLLEESTEAKEEQWWNLKYNLLGNIFGISGLPIFFTSANTMFARVRPALKEKKLVRCSSCTSWAYYYMLKVWTVWLTMCWIIQTVVAS